MFKYICSLTLLFAIVSYSFGQDEEMYAPKKEKEPLELKGIKFGANIGRFSDYLFKPERTSYEASFDFNLSHKYFGVIEAGLSEIKLKKNNYNYLSDGYFIKFGIDYNLLKKHPTDYLGVGIRLGYTDFNHSVNNVIINDIHWPTSLANSVSYKMYWLEASLGIQGEIFKNIYLGWSGLVKMRVSGGKDANFQPYDIPGFGNGSKSVKLGVNYYIYYQIPFNRKY